MGAKYRITGINDDFDTCSCCGRTGLKRVVMLTPLDPDGNAEAMPSPYGTSCAATLMGYGYKTSKDKTDFKKIVESNVVQTEVSRLLAIWTAALAEAKSMEASRSEAPNEFGTWTLRITLVKGAVSEVVRFPQPMDSAAALENEARLTVAMRAVKAALPKSHPLKYEIRKVFLRALEDQRLPYNVQNTFC